MIKLKFKKTQSKTFSEAKARPFLEWASKYFDHNRGAARFALNPPLASQSLPFGHGNIALRQCTNIIFSSQYFGNPFKTKNAPIIISIPPYYYLNENCIHYGRLDGAILLLISMLLRLILNKRTLNRAILIFISMLS